MVAVVVALVLQASGAAGGASVSTAAPEFASSAITDERGDVVPIVVKLREGSSADVDVLGQDSEYEARVRVTDGDRDGLVRLEFNTYLAGTADAFGTASAGDDVRLFGQEQVDGMLQAGTYRLRIGDGSDVADLHVEPRETRSVTTMVAPRGADERLESRYSIAAYREAGNLSRRTAADTVPVAVGDTLALRVKASGLSGALAAQPGDTATERFESLIEGDAVDFAVVQTNPPTSQESATLLIGRSGVHLVPDVRNDAYYLVVDTEAAHFRRGEQGSVRTGLPMGARFAANLTVRSGSTLATDGEETADVAFRVVERSAAPRTHEEVRQGFVEPARGQAITGRTTLAPGSTMTLRVSTPDGDFERPRTLTVEPGSELGTFETAVDLRPLPENTTVEVTALEDGALLTDEPYTATVRTPAAAIDLEGLRTEPGTVYVEVVATFSRGGLVTVRANNDSGRLLGTEPVDPGEEPVSVALQDLPPKDTPLVVTAVRDIDGDGQFTPGVDVPYTEANSPRPLDTVVLLYELPPSPTPTPAATTVPPDGSPDPGSTTTGGPSTGGTPSQGDVTATGTPQPGFEVPNVEEVPGFGVLPAVAAILSALLVLGRRH